MSSELTLILFTWFIILTSSVVYWLYFLEQSKELKKIKILDLEKKKLFLEREILELKNN